MKTATLPSLRVEPLLRASQEAGQTGVYHTAEAVHAELQQRLDTRRRQVLG